MTMASPTMHAAARTVVFDRATRCSTRLISGSMSSMRVQTRRFPRSISPSTRSIRRGSSIASSAVSTAESRRRPSKLRAGKCLVDQLPDHWLQVIGETRIGIDGFQYPFAHRQRLEELHESPRQTQAVAANQLEQFAHGRAELDVFKRNVDV